MANYALSPGVPKKLFELQAVGAALKSAGYALPYQRQPRAIGWRLAYQTTPGAVNVVLQVAFNDVEAEYVTIDTTTNVNGEHRTVSPIHARFVRVQMVSVTGGATFTAEVMI